MASVQRVNPKDNMKSTWRTADKSTWGFFHWVFELMTIHPTDVNKPITVHKKTDPVPYLPQWNTHLWVCFWGLLPLVGQQLYMSITGKTFHPLFAFFYYAYAFKLSSIQEFRMLRAHGHKYGFLDGDVHDRDQIPDNSVRKVLMSLELTSLIRPAAAVLFTYHRNEQPFFGGLTPWVVLETGLYGIVLDFYYYWYHRVMHETDALWQYHRTHHLTKHPNPLLTLFADAEQEFFDSIGIPVLTWATMRLMGLPMGFHDWWMCHQYIVFTELVGHSGLRLFAHPPSTMSWFLKIFDAELVIEDHDLHHRKGWKQSANYGKQTRLWDKAFGTCADRIEMTPQLVDKNYQIRIGLFH